MPVDSKLFDLATGAPKFSDTEEGSCDHFQPEMGFFGQKLAKNA
jgi:hypothetical protein